MPNPIRTVDTTLTGFLHSENKQLRIPIYQRAYTWGKYQDKSCNNKLEGFLETILELSAAPVGTAKFFGFMVALPQGKLGHRARTFFNIIDGQQRLTSLSLLFLALTRELLAEITQAAADKRTNDHKEALSLYRKIRSHYLIFTDELEEGQSPTEKELKFKPGHKGGDLDSYIRLINNQDPALDDNSAISNGYRILLKRLQKHLRDEPDTRLQVLGKVADAMCNLHIAILEVLDNSLSVNSIFESINFKAERLSDFDLIRNFVVEHYDDAEGADYMYKTKWQVMEDQFMEVFGEADYQRELEEFAFCHLRISLPISVKVSRKDIYEIFVDMFTKEGVRSIKSADIDRILDNSSVYIALKKPKVNMGKLRGVISPKALESLKVSDKAATELDLLARRRLSVPLPFLMYAAIFPKGKGVDLLAELTRAINSFFVRNELSNGMTKALAQYFNFALSRYQSAPDSSITDGAAWMRKNLCKKEKGSDIYHSIFPTDDQVIEYVSKANMYQDHYDLTHFLFHELNKFLMGSGYDSKLSAGYEIDHIMPQTLSTDWIKTLTRFKYEVHEAKEREHRLGNLTLVLPGMNKELSNLLYYERLPLYDRCAVILTTELKDKYPNWHVGSIDIRTRYLTDLILKRFA